jgi:hypothetical protein
MSDREYLLLKWGTLKGWSVKTDASKVALQRYIDAGPQSLSAMCQHDNDAQKQALLDLIDTVNGKIQNDWSGEIMTKEEAKKYIMEYGHD